MKVIGKSLSSNIVGIFVIIILGIFLYEVTSNKTIISPLISLFIWYGLVLTIWYYFVWGNLAETTYESAKKIKFLGYDKMPFERYQKICHKCAWFFLIMCTMVFILGLFTIVFNIIPK